MTTFEFYKEENLKMTDEKVFQTICEKAKTAKQRLNEVVRHIVDFDNLAVATTLCKSKTLREYVDYVKSDGNVIDYYFWRFMEETDFQYLVSYETITHNSNEGIKFNVMKKELNLDIMEGYNYEKYRT